MRIPIACTLDDASAHQQVQEWGQRVAASVAGVERPSPEEMHLILSSDLAGLTDLVLLAQREQACCTFLGFALRIDATDVRLVVTAPAEAAPLLDELAALAPGPSPARPRS